jgi:hypothetical protein
MRSEIGVIISLLAALLLANPAMAQNDDKAKKELPGSAKTVVTREKMIEEIGEEVALYAELLQLIPELKSRVDKNGKKSYAYFDGKEELGLDTLDEKKLIALFDTVESRSKSLRHDFNMRELEISEEARNLPKQPPPLPPRPPEQPPRRVN